MQIPKYALMYTEVALRDLAALEKKTAKNIMKKLDFFVQTPNPLKFASPLKNYKEGEYRFRIGDYRAIFDTDNSGKIFILNILAIKHRKEAYR